MAFCKYKYLFFAETVYYPEGGAGDFKFAFTTIEDFKNNIDTIDLENNEWFNILDLETLKRVDINYAGDFFNHEQTKSLLIDAANNIIQQGGISNDIER